ncbi:MAG: T9SS type A sorting domain-containing protein, partial [Flavobacteriales bacterium]
VETADFTIYPNPSNGESVNVAMSGLQKGQLQVRVLDAAGRVVITRAFAVESALNTTLSFDQILSEGVYVMEMTNAGHVTTKRLVVQ